MFSILLPPEFMHVLSILVDSTAEASGKWSVMPQFFFALD